MSHRAGQIRIRLARPGETATLSALSMRAKQSNGYDDRFMAMCREELTISVADLSSAEYWVAETNQVCALVGVRQCTVSRIGEIVALFVEPGWQRQGVGRLLCEQAFSRARDAGMTKLQLDADPAAVRFYEAMGLRIIRSVPSESIPGRMLPQMSIDLR